MVVNSLHAAAVNNYDHPPRRGVEKSMKRCFSLPEGLTELPLAPPPPPPPLLLLFIGFLVDPDPLEDMELPEPPLPPPPPLPDQGPFFPFFCVDRSAGCWLLLPWCDVCGWEDL